MDHIDLILTSLDMFEAVAENLINYTFNVSIFRDVDDFNLCLTIDPVSAQMVSNDMNEVM